MHTWLQQSELTIRTANRRIWWLWSAVAAILIVMVWAATAVKITLDRDQLIDKLRADTEFRAKASSEQLLRMVSQIDQLSMSIKYQWERKTGPLDLEEQYRRGVYQDGLFPVTIDASGHAVTSTRNLMRGTYMGDLPFFINTRASDRADLLISPPAEGRGGFTGRQVVRFARKLCRPDGSFDGVVLIAVEVERLMSFHELTQLNSGDSVAVQFTDGARLAVRGDEAGGIYLQRPWLDERQGSKLITDTALFSDGQPHITSWHRVDGYPLLAIADSSVGSAIAAHRPTEIIYLTIAALASLLLAGVATLGATAQTRQTAQRQRESTVQSTFRLAVDGAREAFYMVRPIDSNAEDWLLEDCNERAAEMRGTPRAELVGRKLTELLHGRTLDHVRNFLRRVLEDGIVEEEFENSRGDDLHVPGWFQRRGVRSDGGVAITVRDVSEARQQAEKLVTLVRTDSLTGLPNRHWLNDYLPGELQRARMTGSRLALLYFDLDNFKNINDALGYRIGDEALQAVGESLRVALSGGDQLARTGGDEFTVIVKHLGPDAADVVRRIAEQLIDRLTDLGSGTAWRMFTMKASVGISLFPDHGGDVDSLLRAADIAMYEAKAQGRGQVQYYDPSFAERIRERIDLEHALTQAIRNDDFTLVYQPRVDARSGRLCATEALLRWQHPERGMVEPLEFISVAEQTGQIVQIGDLVIRKVCAQIAAWRSTGRVVRPVSINVSARQLRTEGLCRTLATYLAEYNIPTSLVAVELTESTVLDEGGVAQEELRQLRRMGVALEIDDFGTGYSSLSKLQSLEIDALKIDRSFVQRLGDDEQAQALCATMVSIGRSLHITVVAEGVERPDQLAALQRMGCDQIQGYQIAPPVPAAQVPDLIDQTFFPARRRVVMSSRTVRATSSRRGRARRRAR